METLKTAECPSLSGKSTLTYNIGSDGKDIHLSLAANTGKGAFGKEWVAVKNIEAILVKNPTLTSTNLSPLFDGKSTNTPGFFLAVLLHLGLVWPAEGKNHYGAVGKEEFKKISDGFSKSPKKKG